MPPTKGTVVNSAGTAIQPAAKKTTRKKTRGKTTTGRPLPVPYQGSGWALALTPEIGEKILEHVRSGMPYSMACNLERVPQSTGASWLAKGEEDPDGNFGDFAADVRQQQAEFVQEAINGIKQAGLNDARQWTALMTLLERIYPEQFRRPSEKAGNTINIAIGNFEKKVHELRSTDDIVVSGG